MFKDFDKVFNIMDESFNNDEMRSYEDQKKLLYEKNYRIIFKKDENNNITAFMTVWEFNEFSYIEHLATIKNCRGSGIGSKLINSYISKVNKPVILEVEPPETSMSSRRVKFYERLGFHFNNFDYVQPPLRKNSQPIKLYIMSYPKALSKDDFINYRNILYKKVYKINDELVK